jgi:hypothetical protein
MALVCDDFMNHGEDPQALSLGVSACKALNSDALHSIKLGSLGASQPNHPAPKERGFQPELCTTIFKIKNLKSKIWLRPKRREGCLAYFVCFVVHHRSPFFTSTAL